MPNPHPNKVPFNGVLGYVDVVSDCAPMGARGHCVLLKRAAAEAALETLIGMGVNYRAGWAGHNTRQKCGVIEEAEVSFGAILVRGYIFGRDFPEVVKRLSGGGAGMSYELADAHVADMRAKVWELHRVTFTGAAILDREKAAYQTTFVGIGEAKTFALAASAEAAS